MSDESDGLVDEEAMDLTYTCKCSKNATVISLEYLPLTSTLPVRYCWNKCLKSIPGTGLSIT